MKLQIAASRQSTVHSDGIARRVVLEKASNFRDLGGFQTPFGQTQFGCLFRSDQLSLLSQADVSILTSELGISQVVDLRGFDELEIAGKGPLAEEAGVSYHTIPVSERALTSLKKQGSGKNRNASISYRYFRRLISDAPSFTKILTYMTDNRKPTVFNCVAGRDRTGLVAMLLLGAAGVGDEDIADDYAATVRIPEDELGRSHDPKLMEFWKDYINAVGTTHLTSAEAMKSAMLELLEILNENYAEENTTGIEGYLQSLGISVPEVRSLLIADGQE